MKTPDTDRRELLPRPHRWAGRPDFGHGRERYLHNRIWVSRASGGCSPPMGFPDDDT